MASPIKRLRTREEALNPVRTPNEQKRFDREQKRQAAIVKLAGKKFKNLSADQKDDLLHALAIQAGLIDE